MALLIIIIVFVLLISSGVGGYLYYRKKQSAAATTPTQNEPASLAITVADSADGRWRNEGGEWRATLVNPDSPFFGLSVKPPEPLTGPFTFEYEMKNALTRGKWCIVHATLVPSADPSPHASGTRIAFNHNWASWSGFRRGPYNGVAIESTLPKKDLLAYSDSNKWTKVRFVRSDTAFQVWTKPEDAASWTKVMEFTGDTTTSVNGGRFVDDFNFPIHRINFLDQGVLNPELRKRGFKLYKQALPPA